MGTGSDRNSSAPELAPLLRNHDLTNGFDWLCNPLVRTHPETGARSLWPSPGDMECFEDIETAQPIPSAGEPSWLTPPSAPPATAPAALPET